MTAADHANTVREYVGRSVIPAANDHSPKASDALDALDALTAQAIGMANWEFVAEANRRAAQAAEAERDAAVQAVEQANRRIEILEITDMTATAAQWEMAFKNERQRAEAAEQAAEQARAALQQYADLRNWRIEHDGKKYPLTIWIGPGATHAGQGAVEIARAALAGNQP